MSNPGPHCVSLLKLPILIGEHLSQYRAFCLYLIRRSSVPGVLCLPRASFRSYATVFRVTHRPSLGTQRLMQVCAVQESLWVPKATGTPLSLRTSELLVPTKLERAAIGGKREKGFVGCPGLLGQAEYSRKMLFQHDTEASSHLLCG